MLNSLGKELSKEDFLVSALGSQHVFLIIQASDTKRPLVVRWPDLLKAILASIPSNPGGQSGVQVQDEGTVISTLAQFINFIGAGVTTAPNGLGVDVTIPGGGGAVDIEDEGNPVVTAAAFINFIGAGVTATANGLGVDVTIPGGGGGGGLLSGTATQVSAGVYTTTIAGVASYTAGAAYVIRFTTANDGASTLNINSLGAVNIFKNTNIPIASGDIKANQEIQVVYDGTNFQAIGLVSSQLLAYVHNAEGAVINKGQVVYAYQATGNKMSVKLARADDDSTSAKTIGLVYDTSIGIGGNGYIIIQGVIEGVNTAAFSAGDTLYLSGTTFGGVTNVKPYAPIHLVYVGIVERANAGNGQIYVRCQNGYELDEIHDVDLISTPPANNDLLVYETGTPDLWKNKSLGALLGGGPADYVAGNGAVNPFPDIPSPTAVYPHGRRQIYGTGDHRAIGFYQDKLFVVNNTANQVRVIDVPTNAVLLTTTVNLANTSQIIDDIAVAEHWCTSTGGAFIARHNAVSGAFIASTTPTGVVTNAQQSRFASFNSVKSIGANLTNVYTINPNTFVTANLSAHGLGALMTYLAINKNPSSLQNGLAMVGGQLGIILFNCNTNAIVLAATTLGGLIGNVLDVAYDSVNDFWFIATLVGGIFRIVGLQPSGVTTFTTVYTILDISSNDLTLTGGNAKQVSILPISSIGQLHICVNQQVFVYNILTGAILKSQYIFGLAGTVRPAYGVLDAPNKRYFYCTGGAGAAIVQELIYDE